MLGEGAGGAGHGLLFALEYPHPLADFLGWPALLQDAGHLIIQATVLFPADGLGVLVVIAHVMPPKLVRCSHPVPASIPAYPASPVLPTSQTDMAPAESRSSCGCRYGPVLGRPCRTPQPASASPGHLPVLRTHLLRSARLAAGHLVSSPAHLVAIGTTAPGRSQARG